MTLYTAYKNDPCSPATGRETWLLFSVGTCLGVIETHVLVSFLWLVLCKGTVINVTLILKIAVHRIQD